MDAQDLKGLLTDKVVCNSDEGLCLFLVWGGGMAEVGSRMKIDSLIGFNIIFDS